MGTVIANMSMSLDGFIEDRSGGVATHLFGWLQSGRRSSTMPGEGSELRTSSASAQYLQDTLAGLGALVSGRTLFDLAQDWAERHHSIVAVSGPVDHFVTGDRLVTTKDSHPSMITRPGLGETTIRSWSRGGCRWGAAAWPIRRAGSC